MNETHSVYQVRRNGEILGVFSTFKGADDYAYDQSEEIPEGSFVVGHIYSGDLRFVPSGFWRNGAWEGND